MATPTVTGFSPSENTDMSGNVMVTGTNFANPTISPVALVPDEGPEIVVLDFSVLSNTEMKFSPSSELPNGHYYIKVHNASGDSTSGAQWINNEC